MGVFAQRDGALEWRGGHETLRIEPWGADSVRVRGTLWGEISGDLPGALAAHPPPAPASPAPASPAPPDGDSSPASPAPQGTPAAPVIELTADLARLTNGGLTAEVSAAGRLRFLRASDGSELLAEARQHFTGPPPRRYGPASGASHRFELLLAAADGERLYGLGQHQHGLLDQKGAVIDLVQRNTEVSVPFLLSSRGYGFLWNHPGTGRVELGATATRWVADSARQWDFWLTAADEPAQILRQYGEVAGRAPQLPEWASGFWQCKLRYKTQDELLAVAHEYKRRGLPLSVIVIDYFHWTRQGDWRFDPAEWPDPAGLVAELDRLGVKLMVSIWPTVNPASENYQDMADQGLLVASDRGIGVQLALWDKGSEDRRALVSYYDATSPRARAYIWAKVKEGYYKYGIRAWWLDACEPELVPEHPGNLRYHIGPGLEVSNAYPMLHARGFYEGMRAEGEDEVLLLCRSAWAGSQRYGALVWSGDVDSTFEDLRRQIPAGLNIGLSGIPWWTTDIGGFKGGDIRTPEFRELIVRWFQFGVFCPVFRLHGVREPGSMTGAGQTGAANEAWSFGDEQYAIIRDLLFLRERIRPYVMAQMRAAHETGLPPMRPLFLNFPADDTCWQVADQFLLGDDLLVAPVVTAAAFERAVYLPGGATWLDAWTGEAIPGGRWITAPAPLELVPAYVREGGMLAPFGPPGSSAPGGGEPG
ncbi:MAG TPA: glycoside hydrolase family 31 protein [Streptosporangiaceae bacterium]|nr:glycoside hydrolase family 31 protein [Streptosporangiaceae bacterium]